MSLFKLKEIEQLQPVLGEFFHTGSRVICDPPPQDTDDDYIVLVGQGAFDYIKQILELNGWIMGGSFDPRKNKHYDGTFRSFKKDAYNLILTTYPDYFESFKRATYLASHLNLLKKEDRITLFDALVRDNYPTKLKTSNKQRKSWAKYYDEIINPPMVGIDLAEVERRALGVAAQEEQAVIVLEEFVRDLELDEERHAEFARDLELEEDDFFANPARGEEQQ